MAKIDTVEQRLRAWAEWISLGRGTGGGTLAMFNGEVTDREIRYNIPLNDEECWKTDTAVARLELLLYETCVLYYMVSPSEVRRRHNISKQVLSQRISRIHHLLWLEWEPKTLSPNSLPTGF